MSAYKHLVDFEEASFQKTALLIILCPLIWNIVARTEYKLKPLRTLFGGNSYAACYAIAVWVFLFSCYRDWVFHEMLPNQPTYEALRNPLIKVVAATSCIVGQVFVWSSAYRLGITGTFLGDYCGILMKERITGFPFNVLEHPMYVGSSMSFLGTSLWNASPAGLLLTIEIYIVYMIASIFFEGPYTTMIYAEKAKSGKKRS